MKIKFILGTLLLGTLFSIGTVEAKGKGKAKPNAAMKGLACICTKPGTTQFKHLQNLTNGLENIHENNKGEDVKPSKKPILPGSACICTKPGSQQFEHVMSSVKALTKKKPTAKSNKSKKRRGGSDDADEAPRKSKNNKPRRSDDD